MVDIVTRAGKGSPLTNNEVDANFTNLAEVAGITGEPMGHEDRTTSAISFNASTRTFTIAPVSGSFTVWCKGKKVVVSSAQTVTIPNTTGMHSIYYDANGTLLSKIGYFSFSTEAPTAYVYWNATTGAAPYFGDERHGVVLDWQTHEYLHRTRGAAIANGFLASGYTLNNSATNAATQIAIESGTFFDEDMKIDIVSTATPTAGTYQQNLLFPAKIPVLHLQGTSWVMDAPTDFPFKQGTSRPQYNSLSGGVWSTADVGNNQHATTWILATNNLTYPVIAIIGQSATDNLGEAEAFSFADLSLTGFPSVEFRPLYKLIYKASDGYANSVNAQLVSIVDLRSISAVGSVANPATDHGNLSGLSDDDHPQYLSVDTVRGTLTAAVKASFLPSQAGNAGKFLTTDATSTSWASLTSGNITTALGFTPYNATNPAGYITGITSSNVTTALGFTPYNATNPSGFVTAAGARGAISVTGAGSYDSATGVINIVGGVTSFNTRTGAITLSSADVTTALGFTPYNSTNPNGYLTGITSTQVTTALGYTPYNSSNPSGYITGITSSMVTTALGFTPYSNANPSGYITNSALSGYLSSASAASTYLPLAGGNLTGAISWGTSLPNAKRIIGIYQSGNFFSGIGMDASNAGVRIAGDGGAGTLLDVGQYSTDGNYTWTSRLLVSTSYASFNGSTILHAGNYNSYALPLSGGTLSGNLTVGTAGNTRGILNTNGDFYSYYSAETSPRVQLGRDIGVSGGAGIAFGGGSYALLGTNDTSGASFYIKLATTIGTVTTSPSFSFLSSGFYVGSNLALHAGNYNSYAPTLTGTGASGTWGINVTGYAATLKPTNVTNSTASTWNPGSLTYQAWGQAFSHSSISGDSGDLTLWLRPSQYSGGGTELNMYIDGDYYSGTGTARVLNASNYSSYALPLSGGGVSGDVGILRRRLSFSSVYNDPNHSIYNNYNNIDGEGGFDGMKINAYAGLKIRTGNASGAVPTTILDLTSSAVNISTALQQSGNQVLHAGNYSSYALPLSGGTVTGTTAFTRTDDNAISVGTIRGRAVGSQSGEFIHLYERVHIGSPAGWGSRTAPSYGLSTYGGCALATDTGSVTIGGNTAIHAGNYSSYALPLGGGTVTGTTTFSQGLRIGPTPGDPNAYIITRTMPAGDPNVGNEATELLLFHSNDPANGAGPDYITLRAPAIRFQTYNDASVADPDNSAGWNNRLTISPAGVVNSVGTLTQGGNQVLHAANINSYIPNWGTGVSGNYLVQRDGNGYIYANHVNFSTGIENPSINSFITENGDGWSRKSSLAHVKNSIKDIADGTWGINITGNSNYSSYSNRLETNYIGGQQLNPQTYFNNGVGLKVAMTAVAGVWSDTLWINGYAGGDVLSMCALHTQRNGTPRMYISTQTSTGTSYGTLYEFLTGYNYASYVNPKSGGWYGSGLPGSRWGGHSVSGGEISFGDGLPNPGQMGILIDGCYVAGENNGFWSIDSANTWGSRRGMYWDGSYLNFTTNSATAYFSNALIGGNQVLHAGNYSSYSVPLGGGTMSGTLSFNQPVGLGFANGQYIKDNGSGGLVIYSGAAVNINGTSISVGGDLTVSGTLRAYSNAIRARRIDWVSAGDSPYSDPYVLRWRGENDGDTGSLSWLELQMNDDSNEEFRIYGYSCSGYGCGAISGNLYHRFDASGNAWHAGNVTAYSDARVKDNVTVIGNAVYKVMQIRGVTFTRTDRADTEKRHAGVIAQEVESVLPEVVDTDEFGMKSVAYGNMVGLLIEAIKEQQSQITELKRTIDEIRG